MYASATTEDHAQHQLGALTRWETFALSHSRWLHDQLGFVTQNSVRDREGDGAAFHQQARLLSTDTPRSQPKAAPTGSTTAIAGPGSRPPVPAPRPHGPQAESSSNPALPKHRQLFPFRCPTSGGGSTENDFQIRLMTSVTEILLKGKYFTV